MKRLASIDKTTLVFNALIGLLLIVVTVGAISLNISQGPGLSDESSPLGRILSLIVSSIIVAGTFLIAILLSDGSPRLIRLGTLVLIALPMLVVTIVPYVSPSTFKTLIMLSLLTGAILLAAAAAITVIRQNGVNHTS